ncbi:MAG: hypothetical protein KKH66_18280 [Proteobacteria bacterium]|nr:hypothetical protein [Pseudomonadota bacterium]MBU4606861.1 hypothetical protein [Pseudomonadota bacterium]MCG2766454.1 hypothetical protein [Desulfarculaceae bacterium]
MAFLSDRDIFEKRGVFFPNQNADFANTTLTGRLRSPQLQGSSYELRLGKEAYISGGKELVKLGPHPGNGVCEYILIEPGDFVMLMTLEKVEIPPEYMAFISIKTGFKNRGLVNISGFHVDPGYNGNLIFSVYNAGPSGIVIRYGEPVFIIFFAELTSEAAVPYEGGRDKIKSDEMNKLTGNSVSPFDLHDRISKLEHTTNLQWGLLAAATVGLLTIVFKALFV